VLHVFMDHNSLVVWNARGLNAKSHHHTLRSLVDAEKPSVVCVQETKLSVLDDYTVMQLLGFGFDYVAMPADSTHSCVCGWVGRGGWLLDLRHGMLRDHL
jgi:exonuclease III